MLQDNWTELVMKRVENFQTNISIASRMGFETGIATPKWTFSSSFLYALSVITTIGKKLWHSCFYYKGIYFAKKNGPNDCYEIKSKFDKLTN